MSTIFLNVDTILMKCSHRLAILMSGNVVEKESLKGTAQQVN